MKNIKYLLAVFLVGCAGTPTSAGNEGYLPYSMKRVGGNRAALVSPLLGQGVSVEGPLTESERGLVWEIDHVVYFASWNRGWTEAVFRAEGLIQLTPDGVMIQSILEEPEIVAAESGKIRFQDAFYRGDQALGLIINRWARVSAAVEAFPPAELSERLRAEWAPWHQAPGFDHSYGPVWFPEIYGYGDQAPVGPWVSGEDLSWDAGWTAASVPEHLREVRDSGTLYRDWEEGLDLWYLAAQWKLFWSKGALYE